MSMEEWEIPYEEDDFESRYADELDMLEEFDEEGEILLQWICRGRIERGSLESEKCVYVGILLGVGYYIGLNFWNW